MKEIFRLCFVLTVISAVSAGVLAFVNQKTKEPIENSFREEKMKAVRAVLPEFDNEPDKDTVTLELENQAPLTLYIGRKGGSIVGAAFPVTAPDGYSGDIEIMVGVDTAGVVRGVEILRHLETPGLGAKIVEAGFREQFENMDLEDKWAVEKDGGGIKQITGATISSRAVTHAIARGLELFRDRKDEILGYVEDPESGAGKTGEGSQ